MTVPTLWTYPLNRFVIHRKKKAKVEPRRKVQIPPPVRSPNA